jgi:uncharacterized coiled-coil protein SlyX
MFDERKNETKVLAEHGWWIARLRDDARVLEQRLCSIEHRMLTLEKSIAKLTKIYCKLDLALASLGDELVRLNSKTRAFFEQTRGEPSKRARGD